jgi:hypothetical protein
MLLAVLLVEQLQRQFKFYASGPAVCLVFWRTLCSLNNPTGERLMVLGQEIGADTTHLAFALPISRRHENRENFSQGYGKAMSIIMSKVSLHQETNR